MVRGVYARKREETGIDSIHGLRYQIPNSRKLYNDVNAI